MASAGMSGKKDTRYDNCWTCCVYHHIFIMHNQSFSVFWMLLLLQLLHMHKYGCCKYSKHQHHHFLWPKIIVLVSKLASCGSNLLCGSCGRVQGSGTKGARWRRAYNHGKLLWQHPAPPWCPSTIPVCLTALLPHCPTVCLRRLPPPPAAAPSTAAAAASQYSCSAAEAAHSSAWAGGCRGDEIPAQAADITETLIVDTRDHCIAQCTGVRGAKLKAHVPD